MPHRKTETCVLLSGTQCWKIWEFHCQIPTFHAGTTFPVSTFVFSCAISTFPHNMQVLVSYTSAPKHFQVLLNDSAGNILFFFPLAARQIHTCRHSNLFSSLHSVCPSAGAPPDSSSWDTTLKQQQQQDPPQKNPKQKTPQKLN